MACCILVHILVLCLILPTIVPSCSAQSESVENKSTNISNATTSENVDAAMSAISDKNQNSTLRLPRLMKFLKDPKSIGAGKQQTSASAPNSNSHIPGQGPGPAKLRQRNDRPPPSLGPPKRLPVIYHRPQAQPPQLLRRVHNSAGPPPPPPSGASSHYGYEPTLKTSYFSPHKHSSGYNNGPGGYFAGGKNRQHPNALGHGPPQQQAPPPYTFKPSPPFNGETIVYPVMEHKKPSTEEHPPNQYALPQQPFNSYPQQHQTQMPWAFHRQQHNNNNNHPHYQQQRPRPPPQQQQKQRQQLHPQMYSVYEDAEQPEHASLQANSQANYLSATSDDVESAIAAIAVTGKGDEVQQYLNFMNSDDYFLPKVDPNYRQLDANKDRQQTPPWQQQQQQQQQQLQQQQRAQQTPPQFHYAKTLPNAAIHPSPPPPPSGNDIFNDPVQVSRLFYQPEGAASQQRTTTTSTTNTNTAAIVRGSYQTGNNLFVVNSDGNKAVHHIVGSPLPGNNKHRNSGAATTPTTAGKYSGVRYSAAMNRTPEPVRFEFTEHDAMQPLTYTNAPTSSSQGYGYKTIAVGPSKVANKVKAKVKTNLPLISSSLDNVASSTTSKLGVSATKKFVGVTAGYGTFKDHVTEIPISHSDNSAVDDDDDNDTANNNNNGHQTDDVEDGDDVHGSDTDNEHNDHYGRIQMESKKKTKSNNDGTKITTSTTAAPAEKQDTEEYCERMCAIVHDDDGEIVCGSDGYMYTSESQMECYSSCLHIDVTIQSKGSCN